MLLNLGARELFGIRRACKTFNETIEESLKLQQAMFPKTYPKGSYELQNLTVNPLLKEYLFLIESPLRNGQRDYLKIGTAEMNGYFRTVWIEAVLSTKLDPDYSSKCTILLSGQSKEHLWRRINISQAPPSDVQPIIAGAADGDGALSAQEVQNLDKAIEVMTDWHVTCVDMGRGEIGGQRFWMNKDPNAEGWEKDSADQ